MHHIAAPHSQLPALSLSIKALMLTGALGLSPVLNAAQEERIAFENQQMILQMFDELQRQIDELKQTTVRRDQFELLRSRVNQLGANVPIPIAPPPLNSAQRADPTPVAYEAAPVDRAKSTLPELGSDTSEASPQSGSLSQMFGYGSTGAQTRSSSAQAASTQANTAASSGAPINTSRVGAPVSESSGANQFTQAQAALGANQGSRESGSRSAASTPTGAAKPAQMTRVGASDSSPAPYNPPIYNYGATGGSVADNQSSRSSGVSQSQFEALSRQINALQRQQANLSAAGGNNPSLSSLKRDIAQLQRDQQQLASLENLPGQISLLNGLPAQVASLESLPDQFDQLQTQVDDLNGSLENSLFQLADIKNSTEARLSEIRSQMQMADNFPTWMKWAMFGLGLLALIAGITALIAASRQRKKINQLKDSLQRDLLRVEDRMETAGSDLKPADMSAFKEEIMALVASQIAASAAPKKSSASDFLAATTPAKDAKITTQCDPGDTSPHHVFNAARQKAPVETPDESTTPATESESAPQTSDHKSQDATPDLGSAAAAAATLGALTKVSDDDLDDYLPAADDQGDEITIMDFDQDDDAPSFDSRSPLPSSVSTDQSLTAKDTSADFARFKTDDEPAAQSENDHDELDLSQEYRAAESNANQSTDTLAMLSLLDHETKSERVKRDLTGQSASVPHSDIDDQSAPIQPIEASTSLEPTQADTLSEPADPIDKPTQDQAIEEDMAQTQIAWDTQDQSTATSLTTDESATEAAIDSASSVHSDNNPAAADTSSASEMSDFSEPVSRADQSSSSALDETIARGLASPTASNNPDLAHALFERAQQFSHAQQIQPALSDYNDLIKLFSTTQNPEVRTQVSHALLESTRLELTRTGTISAARLGQGKSFFSSEPKNRLFMESMELMRAAQRREVSSEIKDLKNVYQEAPELDFSGLEAWEQSLGGAAAERVKRALELFKDWSGTQTS